VWICTWSFVSQTKDISHVKIALPDVVLLPCSLGTEVWCIFRVNCCLYLIMLLGYVALLKTVVFDNVADWDWPFDMTKEEWDAIFFQAWWGRRKMGQQHKLS
jgi:hypothetical protein